MRKLEKSYKCTLKTEGQPGWDRQKPIGTGAMDKQIYALTCACLQFMKWLKAKSYESKLQSCKRALREQIFVKFLWNMISYLYINISNKLLVKLLSKSHCFLTSSSAVPARGALFGCGAPEENSSVIPVCPFEVCALGAGTSQCKEINSGIAAAQ